MDWVLGNPGERLSQEQAEVATAITEMLKREISGQPSHFPAEIAAKSLVFYRPEWAATSINHLRQFATQTHPPSLASSGSDRLLDALTGLAVESYGEMLLPSYPWDSGPEWGHYLRSPVGRKVIEAVRDEGTFPFLGTDHLGFETGTDGGAHDNILASWYLLLYGCGIVNMAWNLAKLQAGVPTLDELVGKLPDALNGVRSFLGGQPTPVTAVVSLTGIRLPEGLEISGNWGRIRAARAEDHPSRLKSMVQSRTTTTTDTGEQIEITDAGDVIFETCIEMTMNPNPGAKSTSWGWSTSTTDDLSGMINRVRLAFALAIIREPRPVLISTWQKVIRPLAGILLPGRDPQFMAARVKPTLLSPDEATLWQSWINIAVRLNPEPPEPGHDTDPARPDSERRDDSDALIDAVIAWESLFGGGRCSESTLRVSASLARSLYAAGPSEKKPVIAIARYIASAA